MSHLLSLFQEWGLSPAQATWLVRGLLLVLSALASWLLYHIACWVVLTVLAKLIRRTRNTWDDALLARKVPQSVCLIVPALAFNALAPLIFPPDSGPAIVLGRLALAWICLIGTRAINSLLDAVDDIYQTIPSSRNRPIQSYLQVLKIISWLIGLVLLVSILINRSPTLLLSGLGAMTAILLLVFKDTILGFVASIQLTANNMVRQGDWIEMPEYGADGEIIEMTVNTVKVRNWDMTITTVPTYALVSDAFKNWRGMEESGGRRMARAISVDMTSVRFLTSDEITRLGKSNALAEYVIGKEKEIAEHNAALGAGNGDPLDGRRQTNLGIFRAYLLRYLRSHPKINSQMTLLVRHMPPGPTGLPIQVYAFSAEQKWSDYEAVMADIFDHILAVMPEFGLRVFQSPSGHDVQRLGEFSKTKVISQ